MRRRIQQLAKGKFEYLKPEVMFSDEKIEIEAYIDEDYEGSFTMTCTNETVFRGVIYSTNPKMECLTPQFDGKENRIRYKFHTQDLKTGVVYQGNFIIVYNGNEYTLPYQVEMKRTYPKTSLGEIKNLEDFAKLAKAKGEEAYQLFYHKSFVHVIGEQEEKALVLYRGITEIGRAHV